MQVEPTESFTQLEAVFNELRLAAELKLKINEELKGHWENGEVYGFIIRMQEELNEIKKAVESEKPYLDVLCEMADLLNFGLMVLDLYKERLR